MINICQTWGWSLGFKLLNVRLGVEVKIYAKKVNYFWQINFLTFCSSPIHHDPLVGCLLAKALIRGSHWENIKSSLQHWKFGLEMQDIDERADFSQMASLSGLIIHCELDSRRPYWGVLSVFSWIFKRDGRWHWPMKRRSHLRRHLVFTHVRRWFVKIWFFSLGISSENNWICLSIRIVKIEILHMIGHGVKDCTS